MEIWQIFLISYVAVGAAIAVTLFRLRRTHSPQRTQVAPSIIASFLSGMLWGIFLPLIVKRLFRAAKEGREASIE